MAARNTFRQFKIQVVAVHPVRPAIWAGAAPVSCVFRIIRVEPALAMEGLAEPIPIVAAGRASVPVSRRAFRITPNALTITIAAQVSATTPISTVTPSNGRCPQILLCFRRAISPMSFT